MGRKINKAIMVILLIMILLATSVGCSAGSNQTSAEDDSLQNILDAGEFILGLDMGFPPMGFVNEDGEIVGFDVDVAQEVCNRLGVKLVLQGIDWSKKESELNEGRIDCIWNGFSVTQDRAEMMCLSEPYMNNAIIFVVPGNSTIMSMEELGGTRVGVQSGSTAEDLLTNSELASTVTIVRFDTAWESLDALSEGLLDTSLVDSVAAFYYIFSSDDPYFILSDSFGEEEYAIAFRKEDQMLCDKVEEIMGEMKSDGTLGQISKEWFGSDITIVK